MLANPPSRDDEPQRQHRRQTSTPTSLDTIKAPILLASAAQKCKRHRKSRSLDQRPLHQPAHGSVSSSTTYLQCLQQTRSEHDNSMFQGVAGLMCRINRCRRMKQEPLEDTALCDESRSNSYVMSSDVTNLERPSPPPSWSLVSHRNQQQQKEEPEMSSFDEYLPWNSSPSSERIAIFDQSSATPNAARRLSIQSDTTPRHSQHQRPQTPQRQSINSYIPMNPALAHFKGADDYVILEKMQLSRAELVQSSSPHAKQPTPMQRAKSLDGCPVTTSTQLKIEVESPSDTGPFSVYHVDDFDCVHENASYRQISESQHKRSSSTVRSFCSSPEFANMPLPQQNVEATVTPKIPIYPVTPGRKSPKKFLDATPVTSPTKLKLSPCVASIESLNLDSRVQASIKETGISIDEIASFIQGPDPVDGKWVCVHTGCGRKFGRKENVKAHVQTHLGDRQYKCDHCNKCFVRGHDLKRHAKIHTGDKPYECLCGNVFARQDALTRHRQRGMCIGGYKGIVRKTVKRGRPRKQRPEIQDRQEKAARTRQKVAETLSSASSTEDESSGRSSPSDIFERLSIRASSPAENIRPNYSLPPEVLTFTPPASPTRNARGNSSPNRSHRSLTPISENGSIPFKSGKCSLEDLPEESPLTSIPDVMAPAPTELAPSLNSTRVSSPYSAPALTDSPAASELDFFVGTIGEMASMSAKRDFELQGPDMLGFTDYISPQSFDGDDVDLFSGKTLSGSDPLSDDFFSFAFQLNRQESDALCDEFLLNQ